MARQLRVIILKPSKYMADGCVERFRWGFMPNSTVPYMRSMTPAVLDDTLVEVHTIDEYVHTDLRYMSLLKRPQGGHTLLALVGVQCHQFHRALDLAAFARTRGCMAVIGGPHVMTRDTSMLHGRGVSFAQSEAELVWSEILNDATGGQLQSVYGRDQRWQQEIEAPVIVPPSRKDLGRYVIPMLGLYPARGCTQPAAVRSSATSVRLSRLPAGTSAARASTRPWQAFARPNRKAKKEPHESKVTK